MFVEIFQILFGGICVGFASSMTVGPVAVLCIQRTLSKGHISGMMSGLGVACADTILAILSFTVYALLKSYIDEYNTVIQICGGVFVVIVGVFIFFKNPVPQIRKNRAGKTHLWQDFVSMFGFTLANFVVIIPYILAFFTMFNIDLSGDIVTVVQPEAVVQPVEEQEVSDRDEAILNYGGNPYEIAEEPETEMVTVTKTTQSMIPDMTRNSLIIMGFLLGAVIWWAALTSIINLFRRGFRPRHMLTINHIAGIVIGALGLYTLLSVLI